MRCDSYRSPPRAAGSAGDDWGVDIDHVPGAAFHAMIAGAGWLEMDGQEPRQLLPGVLLLLPAGPRHRLVAEPGSVTQQFDHFAARQALRTGGTLSAGHGEAHTLILCGSYRQDPAFDTQLLGLLPP